MEINHALSRLGAAHERNLLMRVLLRVFTLFALFELHWPQQHMRRLRASRLVPVLAAVTLLAANVLPAFSPSARAAPGDLPSAIFDPDEVGWASVRGMTSAQYAEYFDDMTDKGYMVTDIEVDVVNGTPRVGAVWQKNLDGRGWKQLRNLTDAEFHDKWTEFKDAGYRLIDQESYVIDDTRYYAGVWVQNKEGLGWASFRNATSAEFSEKFDEYRDAGYMIIDVDAYTVGSAGLRYAAAWVQNSEGLGWAEHRNLTSAEFADKFDAYKTRYRMIDVESYLYNGTQYYAGIWVENRNGRAWSEWRDMTSKQFGDKWLQLRDAGFRLLDFETYPTENGWRYAGIWRQNGDRYDWSLKERINSLAQAEADNFDIPGMSVAIAVNGEFVYLRGFGHADIDDNLIAHSRTIYPLASISKAVAGVFALELDELGEIDINQASSTYIAGLPAHHLLHTVRQTLNNRSGIGHYDSYTGQGFDPPYNTALAAVQDVDHVPLAVPTGSYIYSTFGYTWAGASIEGATGMNVRAAFDSFVRVPYSLNTLRAMHGAPADPFRATGYNGDNDEISPHETSHKVFGGGLEAAAYDLGRFGIKLMDGQILSAASLTDLWTAPDGQANYALGWSVGTEDGSQVVAKSGAQSGSRTYIRMYPEEEIVIVVLTNRKNGGHSPSALAKTIGAIVLDHYTTAAANSDVAAANSHVAAATASGSTEVASLLAVGDFDEPQDEATDPTLVLFPAITNPAQPDPDADEPEDSEIVHGSSHLVYLPHVGK